MTHNQAVRLAARAIAVYLFFWAATDLISLPREILSVLHEVHLHNAVPRSELPADMLATRNFYLRQAILFMTENVLRIALWILAAGYFYRGAPLIQRLLGDSPAPSPE